MNTRLMEDTVFESLFRQVIIDEYNGEIDSIPSKEQLMELITLSPDFELKMRKLIVHEQRMDLIKKITYFCKQTAAVLAITTAVLFGLLLFNPEVRAAVKNTVINWYDKFTSIIFNGEKTDTDGIKEWKLEYIPDGYQLTLNEKLGNVINIEYINDQNNVIYFSFRPEENVTNISIDNEKHLIYVENLNGCKIYIAKAIEEDFENGVIWNINGYTLSIWSSLSVEEIIKMASSAKW